MRVTILAMLMIFLAYFLVLYGGVGFIQDKRFFSSAPKENLAAIPDRKERFRGAHLVGWGIEGIAILLFLCAAALSVWDGVRNGFGFLRFFARFLTVLYAMEVYDIVFFDWVLLCHSNFFPHFYPELKGVVGPHMFGSTSGRISCTLCSTSPPVPRRHGCARSCEPAGGTTQTDKGALHMKRAYRKSQYAKPCEQYCRETYPDEAEAIFQRAGNYYLKFMEDMPDLGENLMAKNMLDWFAILSFYEASDHRLDGETLLEIKRRSAAKLKFLGKFVDGNKHRWPYRLFEKTYVKYSRMLKEHQARGEWMDSWKVEINPDHRSEGFCFHLVGCPIARHAKEHGYAELLPYLCRTDHFLAEVMHARLIRTKTEALGGDCCDYWYVGDKSPVLADYKDLEQI